MFIFNQFCLIRDTSCEVYYPIGIFYCTLNTNENPNRIISLSKFAKADCNVFYIHLCLNKAKYSTLAEQVIVNS